MTTYTQEELDAKVKEAQQALLKPTLDLLRAVVFYGNPDTWFATTILADPPCGPIVQDYMDHGLAGVKPGKRTHDTFMKFLSDLDELELDENTLILDAVSLEIHGTPFAEATDETPT